MLLSLEKINTFYGLAHILYDVTLSVGEGETVSLLGRNGAGKTTTLRSIMGLTPPTSGTIRSRTNCRTVSRIAFSSSSRSASMARKSRGSSAVGFAVVATFRIVEEVDGAARRSLHSGSTALTD